MANMYMYTFIYILYIQLKSQHIFILYKMFIILYNLYNYTICFKVMDWMNENVVLFEIRLYFYSMVKFSFFNFREEQERLNVWVAYLNLENMYGTPAQLQKVLERAIQQNEPLNVYQQLVNIYVKSGKLEVSCLPLLDLHACNWNSNSLPTNWHFFLNLL